ncbi:MAG: Lrp/AsnC family transcriptional regulator [Firmicutes bacterium]|jgi:Lrp/AsnC family transcriptional regulator for asnA, asnC and gidA|nr:Lrp/AsnC family transcriptional regulator [Bacillota bacterium]
MGRYLDEVDWQIIRILQKDGRTPYLTIANELGMAEGTVRRRVARLQEEGVMKIVGVADPFKVGLNTIAVVGMKVERHRAESIISELQEMPEVRSISVTTGNHDLIIEVVLPTNEELLTFLIHRLSEIPGILNTGTSLVLKVAKQNYSWTPPRVFDEEESP